LKDFFYDDPPPGTRVAELAGLDRPVSSATRPVLATASE
jgi:hypothetical protein